jgi:uncharacterized protein (UPF0548 family)
MFSFHRRSASQLDNWLTRQGQLLLSYPHVGCTNGAAPASYVVDHNRQLLGYGAAVFAAGCAALQRWAMFDLGWVTAYPTTTPLTVGAVVSVIARFGPLQIWNACRIVYTVDYDGPVQQWGFAYGTLPGHVARGEERFLIEWNRATDEVFYDLLAYSQPQHPLAKIGYPIVRRMQARFARDSKAAMLAAVASC